MQYLELSYIMYMLCDKTSVYYARIKNIIHIPIILCSTSVSILNTTEFTKEIMGDKIIIIRLCTIIFNLLTAISVAILNVYKITEREFSFKSLSVGFLKIHNKMNIEIARNKNINKNIDGELMNLIKEYNALCESLTFHIPEHIQRNLKKNSKIYKLPFMNSANSLKINKQLLINAQNDSPDSSSDETYNNTIINVTNIKNLDDSDDSSSDSKSNSIIMQNFGSFKIVKKNVLKRKDISSKSNCNTSPLRALSIVTNSNKFKQKKNSKKSAKKDIFIRQKSYVNTSSTWV